MKQYNIDICGIPYKVKYVDHCSKVNPRSPKPIQGEIDLWNREITIVDNDRSAQDIWQTILHEILHGIGYDFHLEMLENELNHDQLDMLALAFMDFLFRNGIIDDKTPMPGRGKVKPSLHKTIYCKICGKSCCGIISYIGDKEACISCVENMAKKEGIDAVLKGRTQDVCILCEKHCYRPASSIIGQLYGKLICSDCVARIIRHAQCSCGQCEICTDTDVCPGCGQSDCDGKCHD